MGWLETSARVLTVAALLVGVASFAETFRTEPMWLRASTDRPGQSPRQRRWYSIGVSVMMAGLLLSSQLEGDTWLWALVLALVGGGASCIIASFFVRPSEHEQRRRAQLLSERSPDAA